MDESEIAHLSELAELRERVMELQTKDSHTPDELAELDMLRNRVLGFQASTPGLPIAPAAPPPVVLPPLPSSCHC